MADFNLEPLSVFKENENKDEGKEFDIFLDEDKEKTEKNLRKLKKEEDEKRTISYFDAEDLRLYDVFKDTPSIAVDYLNKKEKTGYASISFDDIKDTASPEDIERFFEITKSQDNILSKSVSNYLPKPGGPAIPFLTELAKKILTKSEAEKAIEEGRSNRTYPSLNVEQQEKNDLEYDIFERKRPLSSTDLPWYKQKKMALDSGFKKGGLGFVETAAAVADVGAELAGYDPNFLKEVEELTDQVSVNSDTFTNKLFDIAGQYVVPFGVVNKLANGFKIVKGFKEGKKLDKFLKQKGVPDHLRNIKVKYSKVPLLKLTDKTYNVSKVASRGAYYGGLAGGVDALVSTSSNATFGDYFGGPTEQKDLEGLEGYDRAIASLTNKLKFGVEGTLGFGIMSTAGKPVIKTAFSLTGKTLGASIKTLDFLSTPIKKILATEVTIGGRLKPRVADIPGPGAGTKKLITFSTPKLKVRKIPFFDPTGKITQSINKFLSSSETVYGGTKYGFFLTPDLLKNGRNVIAKFLKERGVPKFEDWQALNYSAYNPLTVFKKLNNIFGAFTSSQYLPRRLFDTLQNEMGRSRTTQKEASLIWENIKRTINNLGSSKELDDLAGTTSKLQFDFYSSQIMDFLRGVKNKNFINNLHPKLRTDVIKLKNLIEQHAKKLSRYVDEEEIKKALSKDIKAFFDDHYRLFLDKSYVPSQQAAKKMQAYIRRGLQALRIKEGKTITKKDKKELATLANQIYEDLVSKFKGADYGGNIKKAIQDLESALTESGVVKPGTFTKPGQDLHKVVASFLGKIDDPRNLYMEVLAKITDTLAMRNAHAALYRQGKNVWLFDTKKQMMEAFSKRLIQGVPTEIGYKAGVHSVKSPLTGKWTTAEIAKGLENQTLTTDVLEKIPFYKMFIGLKALTEYSKTVLSYMTHMRNVNGNTFIALYNGHYGSGASLFDSFNQVIRDLSGKYKGSKEIIDELGQELSRWGLSDTSVVSRQFQYLVEEVLKGKMTKSNQFFKFLTKNKFVDFTTRLYQQEDNLWKTFGYLYKKSELTRVIKTIPQMERHFKEQFRQNLDIFNGDGTRKTLDEMIQEAAAKEIRDLYPNYDMVGRFFKESRRIPIMGNFVSFPAEITRNMLNGLKYEMRRAKSSFPEFREQAVKGLFGKTAIIAGIPAVTALAYRMHGMDIQMYNDLKKIVAPWDVNADLMMATTPIIGINKKTGEIKFNKDKLVYGFANSTYHVPQGFALAPINAMINAFFSNSSKSQSEIFYDAFIGNEENKGAFREFMDPFMSESIIAERVFDLTIRKGKTKTGKTIVSRLDDPAEAFIKSMSHVFQGLEPGTFNSLERIFLASEGQKTGKKELNLQLELLKILTGIGITEVDIKQSYDFDSAQFGRDLGEARAEFFRFAGKPRKETIIFGTTDITREDRAEQYFKTQLQQYEIMSNFNSYQKSMNNLGLDSEMQDEILNPGGKPKSGLTKKIINNLEDNIFTPMTELSENEGSFIDRFIKEYGGEIADHFDMRKMEQIYDFFDNDLILGHSTEDIIRLYNREILSLPTLPSEQNEGEGVEIDLDDEPEDVEIPNLPELNFSKLAPEIPITQPQMVTAQAPVASPTAVAGQNPVDTRQRIIENDEFLKDLA